MPKIAFSEARIKAFAPRSSVYDIRDAELRGFGVRVLPSGTKRFFIHTQYRRDRTWRIVGDATTMTVDEARTRAASLLAAIRNRTDTMTVPEDTRFETVAEAVFQRHARVWKPGTLRVNRVYLRRQILPAFRGQRIADISRRDVQRWFASLRATPAAANRSMPILSVILKEAELMGCRPEGSNPCRGIRRYRRKGREHFLSDEEIGRIAARLAAHEARWPLEVAAIRLLMLTGCRKGEIVTLHWSDYREGHLFLRDSKIGPRTVWLSHAARHVLERIPRTNGWVFSFRRTNKPRNRDWLHPFWSRVRAEAGLSELRIHDIRHSYASFALRQGKSVVAIGKLLGHADPQTTLKYTHWADAMVREAAETVAEVLEG